MQTMDAEARKKWLSEIIREDGRTRDQGIAWAAELLHVSPHTVFAWIKPATSKSALEVPMWAVELLWFKAGQPDYGDFDDEDREDGLDD